MIEWMRILDLPIEDVVSFLCDQGEHATRLRQSSPFTGILTDQERLAIFEDQEFLAARPHNLNSGVTVWHTTIQDADDGSGDGILELPSDLLMQLGWKEGDLLTIEKMDSGELILRRAEKL